MRFLYGEPAAVGTPDPGGNEGKSFRLTEDGGMALKQVLTQKPLARACAAWIREQVEIRTITRANFLHGKLYHIARANDAAALAAVPTSLNADSASVLRPMLSSIWMFAVKRIARHYATGSMTCGVMKA